MAQRAKALARELDANRFVPREDPLTKENRRLERDEIKFALTNLDAFHADDRPIILELARALGVDVPKSIPKVWIARQAPERQWTSGFLDAVALGSYVFISDRRKGILRYDTTNDQWFQVPQPNYGQSWHRVQSSGIGEFKGKLAIVGTYPNQQGPAWGAVRLHDPETGRVDSLPDCRHRCARPLRGAEKTFPRLRPMARLIAHAVRVARRCMPRESSPALPASTIR